MGGKCRPSSSNAKEIPVPYAWMLLAFTLIGTLVTCVGMVAGG